jgi:hypothetical protein
MKTEAPPMTWPRIRVQYHGSRPSEIITLEEATKRYKLRADEVGWLKSGEIAGTSLNTHPGGADVYMIHRYSLEESIRDAGPDLLRALEGILDHDLVPRNSVAGRTALAAIAKANGESR